jgi:hypothetical protein
MTAREFEHVGHALNCSSRRAKKRQPALLSGCKHSGHKKRDGIHRSIIYQNATKAVMLVTVLRCRDCGTPFGAKVLEVHSIIY